MTTSVMSHAPSGAPKLGTREENVTARRDLAFSNGRLRFRLSFGGSLRSKIDRVRHDPFIGKNSVGQATRLVQIAGKDLAHARETSCSARRYD
jgi:hypothetical protein